MFCENALETILELEDTPFTELEQKFPIFVKQVNIKHFLLALMLFFCQEIYKYNEKVKGGGAKTPSKPCKEISCPSLLKIGQQLYLIGSSFYKLNKKSIQQPAQPYAEKLTDQEVLELPLTVRYIGPPTIFSCDEKAFIQSYAKIILNFNKMQDMRFWSYPVGKKRIKNY